MSDSESKWIWTLEQISDGFETNEIENKIYFQTSEKKFKKI